ncbi:NAD(P)H-hydrate dehydratase [Pseudogemmobacter humi]|uniref:NAD(P)H-hydrate dehydratase n=1 Tax=Pseudogemmobacter humi TaxID=2483812 RepID=UPI000F51F4A6|nr:NAD(P)H-hydrate dehydratase [Pseudogemmobacter humi]
MTELLTAAQMRAIEKAAIDSGEVTGLELMERAGRGVVEAIFAEWPELAREEEAGGFTPGPPGYLGQDERALRAVVLCGPGNNGGDGFVVARLLREHGWEVEVFLYGDPGRLPSDARVNYERWCGMGQVHAWDDARQKKRFEEDEPDFHLVIDALFGTGLSRPMSDDTDLTWQGLMPGPLSTWAHAPGAIRFVAIDVPSGMCGDSGKDMGAMPAHLTVTFHRARVGHYMHEACGSYGGAGACHKLRVVDIGLPQPSGPEFVRICGVPGGPVGKHWWQHKYTHGHSLILSGPPGHGGAARLSARGALRIGAGLVTLGCPPAAVAENAARLDAVMLREVADAGALAAVLEDRRINALCLGPGLGISDETRALTAQGLKSGRAAVLDADALTLIAGDAALFAALHEGCVLTPHGGEFARLFPDLAEKLAAPASKGPAYSKVDAAREAAARAGAVVLFKGPDTVIAGPSGRCAVNAAVYERAAPWLATAGAGDVLAGFIAGLLARGFSAFDAACTGAWLHVECARSFGPGLIAEDLPEELPKVFRSMGL